MYYLILAGALLIFFGVFNLVSSSIKKRKLLAEIAEYTDTDILFAYAEQENDAAISEAAKDRLRELAETVSDADLFLRIRSVCGLDVSVFSRAAERFSPEDLLLKAAPVFDTDDPACEAALEHIWDEKILAEIIGKNYGMTIRRKALSRITDPELLYQIALDNPEWVDALDRIKDRDQLYAIALAHPDCKEAVGRLDMEQIARFGMDCCRKGIHDWEVIDRSDTTNEELDIRGYQIKSRCRRCGRVELKDHDDVHGTEIVVLNRGLFGEE